MKVKLKDLSFKYDDIKFIIFEGNISIFEPKIRKLKFLKKKYGDYYVYGFEYLEDDKITKVIATKEPEFDFKYRTLRLTNKELKEQSEYLRKCIKECFKNEVNVMRFKKYENNKYWFLCERKCLTELRTFVVVTMLDTKTGKEILEEIDDAIGWFFGELAYQDLVLEENEFNALAGKIKSTNQSSQFEWAKVILDVANRSSKMVWLKNHGYTKDNSEEIETWTKYKSIGNHIYELRMNFNALLPYTVRESWKHVFSADYEEDKGGARECFAEVKRDYETMLKETL